MIARTSSSPLRWLVAIALVLAALLVLGGRAMADGGQLFHEQRPAMGTFFEVFVYASDEAQAHLLFEAAFEEVERIEAVFSTYRPESELSRINARAAEEPVTTDLADECVQTSPTLAARGDEPTSEAAGVPIEVEHLGPTQQAVSAFIACVREGRRPLADARVGRGSSIAVAYGHEAIRTGRRVDFANRTEGRYPEHRAAEAVGG